MGSAVSSSAEPAEREETEALAMGTGHRLTGESAWLKINLEGNGQRHCGNLEVGVKLSVSDEMERKAERRDLLLLSAPFLPVELPWQRLKRRERGRG